MKSKKSKSTVNLSSNIRNNPQVKIARHQLQDLYNKQAQLEGLQDKVDRSKPILENIYNKFKLKQQKHQFTVLRLKRKQGLQKNLVHQYKELYHEGLRIMSRNRLIDRFKGYSNYYAPNTLDKQSYSGKMSLTQKLKKQYRNKIDKTQTRTKTIENIKEQYQSRSLSLMTKEQIYQRYKEKLDSDPEIRLKESSPHLRAKKYSRKLLQKFDSDLMNLTGKTKPFPKQRPYKKSFEEQELKKKYLQIQKQKLQSI